MKSNLKFEDLLSVGQVSKMLGRCTKTIREWHARGKLVPCGVHPVTNHRFYDRKDIIKFIEKNNKK